MENAQEVDRGDDYNNVSALNATEDILTMVKMANFTLCIFYHNFLKSQPHTKCYCACVCSLNRDRLQ